jgi:hypothetical protein
MYIVTGDAVEKGHLREVGKLQVGFTAVSLRVRGERKGKSRQCGNNAECGTPQ